TTEDDPRSATYCAVLRSKRATKRSATLTQRISALPFRTRRIRLSAWARVTVPPKPASQAQLWLRIDRPGGVGFVDEMSDRPILSKEWKRYEIVGDVDADATSINFGARFTREGAIWLDDVALEVIPNVKVRNEAPRALNRQQVDNIVAFTKLLGYVRHFHPSDEAASVNWNDIAVRGIR